MLATLNMHFREIASSHLEEIFRIRASTRENAMTKAALADIGVTPESVAKSLDGSARGWVCMVSDQIVGFVMGDGATGEVLVLAVLPEYEGKGIGRALMNLVQDWLFEEGWDTLWLHENPDPAVRAYGFYRRLGWYPAERLGPADQILRMSKGAYQRCTTS